MGCGISPNQPVSAHVTSVGGWVRVLLPCVGQGLHTGAALFSMTAEQLPAMPLGLLFIMSVPVKVKTLHGCLNTMRNSHCLGQLCM